MSHAESLNLSALPRLSAPAWALARLHRLLSTLRFGHLTVVLPDGNRLDTQGRHPGPEAVLVVHRWRALWSLAVGGDLGLADAFIAGHWSSPDLPAFLTLGAMNFANPPTAWPLVLLRRLRHGANANSRRRAKRNIMAHYDLGNDFYAAWLDGRMLYSSGLHAGPDTSLDEAQSAKLALIQDWLAAAPGHDVLEIGAGWGALALALARTGADVTGLTLSPAQRAYAQTQAHDQGLTPRARFALRDYRDETGRYDRIVSIEMLEAVGEAYWPVYFDTLRRRLKPGGKAVLQVITIEAARFAAYRGSPDFIQRHIFPGGMLPTRAGIAAQALRAGLTPGRVVHFGQSYAHTLSAWRGRFLAAWQQIAPLGFDERFRRLWDYYLSYCEAGFAAGAIDVGLYEFHA